MSRKYKSTKTEIFDQLQALLATLDIPIGMGGIAAAHWKAQKTVPWGIYTRAPSAIIGGQDTYNMVGIMLPIDACQRIHQAAVTAHEATAVPVPEIPTPMPFIAHGPAIIVLPPTSGRTQ